MEHIPQPSAEKLQDLHDRAQETFGEDTLFTYRHEGDAYTLTFTEALDICGQHIAQFSIETVIGMLQGMYEDAQLLAKYDKLRPGENRLEHSIERGQAKHEEMLAKRALAQYNEGE